MTELRRWEYMTFEARRYDDTGDWMLDGPVDRLLTKLRLDGDGGWELAAMVPVKSDGDTVHAFVVMKRLKDSR